MTDNSRYALHDIPLLCEHFPKSAETRLVDAYLSDAPEASARLFRIYHPLPAHYHNHCDEHLYLYSGEVLFQIEDQSPQHLTPGQMVTFKRETVHAITRVRAEPAIFLTVDAPRRAPDDVVFIDPQAAQERAFVSHVSDYDDN